MVSERGLEVLRVIVEDYVATREPVGSKSIVERHGFGVSSATIRNDMAQLEEEGLITAPHTSSGRIPTDKGYRAFVDKLSQVRPLSPAQRKAIESFMGQAIDLEDVLSRTVRLLAHLTNQVAVVQYPVLTVQRVRHVEVLPLGSSKAMTVFIADGGHVDQRIVDLSAFTGELDDELIRQFRARANDAIEGRPVEESITLLGSLAEQFTDELQPIAAALAATLAEQATSQRPERLMMAGTANLARTGPDFPGSITPVLDALEEQVTLLRLFTEMEADQYGIAVRIGRENEDFGLGEASVLAADYSAPGGVSHVGLVGPTRMDYSTNIAAVRAVARYLSRLLGEQH